MGKNYLRATAKAVKTLTGPFGAPLEFLLSLYEDELNEDKEKKLKQFFETNEKNTTEALEGVFEVKNELYATREMLTSLVFLLKGPLQKIEEQKLAQYSSSPDLVRQLNDSDSERKVLTEKAMVNELIYLYGNNPPLFLTIVRNEGFPVHNMPLDNTPKILFSGFVQACRGVSPSILRDCFRAISEDKGGSILMKNVALMFEEFVNLGNEEIS